MIISNYKINLQKEDVLMKNFTVLFKDSNGCEFEYSMIGFDLWDIDNKAKYFSKKMGWTYIRIL